MDHARSGRTTRSASTGSGLLLVLLTTILTPVVILASWDDADGARWSVNAFFALMLTLEGLSIGVFAATDVFLFYVLFEATLIPIYFLIGGFGGPQRSYAAVKFLLYSLFGGLLMLASVIGLYVVSSRTAGGPSYLLQDLMKLHIDQTPGRWLFLGFFVAFAVKAPMWPLHTWLPDAASEATPGTSVLLVSVLDKIGTFGMMRFCLGLFPEASKWASPVIMALAVFSVIYGALLAIGQNDIRRLIAYTSISHFGFIVLGIFALTSTSQAGLGALHVQPRALDRRAVPRHRLPDQPARLEDDQRLRRRREGRAGAGRHLPGRRAVEPVAAGLSPFVSEFLVLAGTFTSSIVAAVIATFGIVLAAHLHPADVPAHDDRPGAGVDPASCPTSTPREIAALAPLLVLIVVLGFFPKPALDAVNPTVTSLLHHVGRSTTRRPTRRARSISRERRSDRPSPTPTVPLAGPRLRQALAAAHRLRRRARRRAGRGVRAARAALPDPDAARARRPRRRVRRGRRRRRGPQTRTPVPRPARSARIEADGAIAVDGPSLFIWGTLLILSIVSVMLFAERHLEGGVTAFAGQASALPGTQAEREASARGIEHTEIFPLMTFAVGGMMLFSAANDFLTMFVALEVFSLPLYLLCGLARRRRLISQEAAMKYFLLGAFSSAFFLYGIALVYGFAGSVRFADISNAISSRVGRQRPAAGRHRHWSPSGLLFKVSAAPFHSWTPDVYQGAPTAVTAFMAACTKLAAFGALLRVFYVALGGARWDWQPMFWIVAVITMAVGSIIAITQTDIKRMLAYSSIAHAGFLLTGFVGATQGVRDHRPPGLEPAGRALLPRRLRLQHRSVPSPS